MEGSRVSELLMFIFGAKELFGRSGIVSCLFLAFFGKFRVSF